MALTELEGVILGIVSSRAPCSAYVVRQRFAASPTWGWSSSKGSIYPAIQRLVSRGFLTSTPAAQGRRPGTLLTLSDTGDRALVAWVEALSEEMGAAPVDPIRTRVNYLAGLDPAARLLFLDEAERAVRAALMAATTAMPDPDAIGRWTLHATLLGVQMQLRAKLDWLAAVRFLLSNEGQAIFPEP